MDFETTPLRLQVKDAAEQVVNDFWERMGWHDPSLTDQQLSRLKDQITDKSLGLAIDLIEAKDQKRIIELNEQRSLLKREIEPLLLSAYSLTGKKTRLPSHDINCLAGEMAVSINAVVEEYMQQQKTGFVEKTIASRIEKSRGYSKS